MAWNSLAPDTSRSVKANGSLLLENTQYIEATMGSSENNPSDDTGTDVVKDHYWDISSNLDGRHRYVNMPEYTIDSAAADPVLGLNMGGVSYCKEIEGYDIQPFFRNAGGIMQILGIRAYGVYDISTSGEITEKYVYNCTLSASAQGRFQASFTTPLPTRDYILLGGCLRYDLEEVNIGYFSVASALDPASVKNANSCKFITTTYSGSPALVWPTSLWFVAFGG